MMIPHPHDDPDGPEPRADRFPLDFSGPHGPEHEAALHALLERESDSRQAFEWSGACQQCHDELLRLRELSGLLDEAAADRRQTLESARALRVWDDELVADFVRSKLTAGPAASQRRAEPQLVKSAGPRPARADRPARAANAPGWQRAWTPWVAAAAGIALVVGWWLRSILPAGSPLGTDVTLSTREEAQIAPEGPVDSYDEFRWDIAAPEGGSLVLRIWDDSSADSAELLHTIRLDTDQRSWRADNLWKGRGPESISWQVEALDSTAQFRGATRLVQARLRPR